MRKTLIKSIYGNESKLYIVKNGRRSCENIDGLKIQLYEESCQIKRMGCSDAIKRSRIISIVVAKAYIDNIDGSEDFSIETDLQRVDTVYERVCINNAKLLEINNDGLMFEIDNKYIDFDNFL